MHQGLQWIIAPNPRGLMGGTSDLKLSSGLLLLSSSSTVGIFIPISLHCCSETNESRALNLGLLCVACNIGIFLYLSFWVKDMAKVDDRWEILAPAAIPTATVIGLLAFFLFCLALWPIWSFLTLPLLFTLFMAFVVISPYIPTYVKMKPDAYLLRSD